MAKIKLTDTAQIRANNILGDVIGKAKYSHAQTVYLLEHLNGTGDLVTEWYQKYQLRKVGCK